MKWKVENLKFKMKKSIFTKLSILFAICMLASVFAKSQLSSKDTGSMRMNPLKWGTGYMDTVSYVTKWNDGRYEVSGDTMKVLKLLFLRLEEANKRELDLWACVATGIEWLNGVGDYFKTNKHNKAWSKYEAALSKLGYRTKNKKRRK